MTAVCIANDKHLLRDWEVEAGRLVCRPCIDQMRAWLTAIPAAMTVLREGSMQRERTGESGRSGTRTAPLPCREEVLSLVGPASPDDIGGEDQIGDRPIIGVLGDWVLAVVRQAGATPPARRTEADYAAWLIPNLPYVAAQPWADGMYEALWKMTTAIRGVARVEVRTRPVSRPCPTCQILTLTRTDGDQYTRCTKCLGLWTDSELNDDAPRQLEALADAEQAAA